MTRRQSAFTRLPVDSQSSTFRPQLTSLVDVMTILLVFLLKSFSVEGQIVTPADDLELPLSTSQKPPLPVCNIEITRSAVASEGTVIAPLESFSTVDTLLIEPLYRWMQIKRAQCADTLQARQVMIQSDRTIPFNVIKRVMYTCSKAGIVEFSVLVLEQQ